MTRRVIVLGPIAEYDVALPRILARDIYWGEDESSVEDYLRTDRHDVDLAMKQAFSGTGVEYVSVLDAICPNGICTLWSSADKPLQFDYGHLTADGSKLVISRLINKIVTPR